MPSLLRKLLPATRLGVALWAWRNRETVLGWSKFGVRAVQSAVTGEGTADAKAEFRLRARLARDSRTRSEPVEVRVDDGVATIGGKLRPDVRAAVQDMATAADGVKRVDDRIRP